MDWDKLRIFRAVVEAGSFTHAGFDLGLSQSAVSRQISALEHELNVPLFHRHARGLILTEQGEVLHHTAHEVFNKLEYTRARLTDSKDKPTGELRITTTMGLGTIWLTPRISEFIQLYPQIQVSLILEDNELDLAMRQADVAIRLRQPIQPELIQRKLFTVHYHLYSSPEYIRDFGMPETIDDLDKHRLISFGPAPTSLANVNWLEYVGRPNGTPHQTVLRVNSVYAQRRAVEAGLGLAALPDYIVGDNSNLITINLAAEYPVFDTYFVYPEELKQSKRLTVFRDFIVAKAKEWKF